MRSLFALRGKDFDWFGPANSISCEKQVSEMHVGKDVGCLFLRQPILLCHSEKHRVQTGVHGYGRFERERAGSVEEAAS